VRQRWGSEVDLGINYECRLNEKTPGNQAVCSRSPGKLEGKPWFMLEISNHNLVEPVLHRICKKIPSIFRDEALEIFVVDARDDISEL
jgi:hypothetical protein